MGVRIKGSQKLRMKLDRLSKEGAELVKEEVFATLQDVRNGAVTNVNANSTDMSFLKNSIAVAQDIKTKGMGGVVTANVHYAPYVEFGTGAMVDVPSGLEDYAIQFKGKGVKQVNLPPQPFLFPVWFKETKELIPRLEKGLAQIVKK